MKSSITSSSKNGRKSTQMADYEIPIGDAYKLNARRKLGSGAFGDIYLGINLKLNEEIENKTYYVDVGYAWRVVDGKLVVEKYGEIPAYIEIDELKTKLRDTDYQATKYAEGWFTEEEYAPIKAQRQAWRDRINELEKQ